MQGLYEELRSSLPKKSIIPGRSLILVGNSFSIGITIVIYVVFFIIIIISIYQCYSHERCYEIQKDLVVESRIHLTRDFTQVQFWKKKKQLKKLTRYYPVKNLNLLMT